MLIFTHFGRIRTVTPVWIHQCLQNGAQSLKQHWRGALLFLKVICQISRSHGTKKSPIWTQIGCFWAVTPVCSCDQAVLWTLLSVHPKSLTKNYYGNTTPSMASSHHWRNVWRNIAGSRPKWAQDFTRTSQKNNRTSQKNNYQHPRNFWNFLIITYHSYWES